MKNTESLPVVPKGLMDKCKEAVEQFTGEPLTEKLMGKIEMACQRHCDVYASIAIGAEPLRVVVDNPTDRGTVSLTFYRK